MKAHERELDTLLRKNLAFALAATVALGACAPTITELRKQQVANVRVESQPAGATVLVDGKSQGTTPTTARLKYTVVHEKVTNNNRRRGGVASVVLGALSAIGGIVLLGAASGGWPEIFGPAAGGTLLAGIVGLAIGLQLLKGTSTERTRVVASNGLDLDLRWPGATHIARVRIKGDGALPPYDKVPLLRFDARTKKWYKLRALRFDGLTRKWSASHSPASLELLEMRQRNRPTLPSPKQPARAPRGLFPAFF